MSDGASSDRLAQLLSRWESDPSSRIFLQVAEEYRHRGRVKEALAVLERGLKEHPGYLSALVAKGRCHLELGEADVARTVLERVVKQDATQMVANKLLVRAYLETGEPEKARERLDLYTLLNDSDPETEELRRRIRAMDQTPQAEKSGPKPRMDAPPPLPPGGADLFDLGQPAPSRRVDDVFELGVPATRTKTVPEAEPFADLLAPPPAPPAPAPAAPLAAAPPPPVREEAPEADDREGEGDLFPGLASPASLRRYLEGLAAEGLFAVEMPSEPAAVATPAAEPQVWQAPEPEPEPFPEPLPTFAVEPEPFVAEPEPASGPEEAREPVATVTLGEIYLRQGHLQEAARIFREVLQREPDNAAAQAGLDRVPGTPPRPLDADQLLAGFDPAAVPAGIAPASARKAFVLNSYLHRLRGGSQPDVS